LFRKSGAEPFFVDDSRVFWVSGPAIRWIDAARPLLDTLSQYVRSGISPANTKTEEN